MSKLKAARITYLDADGRTVTLALDAQTDRERRQARVGVLEPGPTEVGCYPDVTRTTQAGVVFTAGGVVENRTITGRLSVPKNSGQDGTFTLRNCELVGPTAAPAGGDGIIAATGANHLVLILEDCTLHPQAVNYYRNGAMGHHVVMRGCDVYGGVDGFDVFNTNDPAGPTGVVLEGNRFRDVAYFAANAAGAPGSQTHSDPLQIMGGSGTRVVGNSFQGFLADGALNTHGTNVANACIMIKDDVGQITDLVIRNNWFDGGRVPINIALDTPPKGMGDIVICDNVFGPNSDSAYAITMPAAVSPGVVCTGNVYADGSGPVLVNRNA